MNNTPSGQNHSMENSLKIQFPNEGEAIRVYRQLLDNHIARAKIDRVRTEGNCVTVRSKIKDTSEISGIIDAINEAREDLVA